MKGKLQLSGQKSLRVLAGTTCSESKSLRVLAEREREQRERERERESREYGALSL